MTLLARGYMQRRSRAAPWGWLIVVLLHLLMLVMLRELQHSESSQRKAKNAAPSETRGWLVAMPLLKPKLKPLPKPQQPAKPEEPALAPRASITAPSSLAVSPQINKSAAPISTTAALAPEAPGRPKLPSERLNLSLPTRPASAAANGAAQMAAQDPRGNSQRPDMGERMAAALGSDPSLREEIINPGHRRIRQGSACIDVNDTRNSQLNPFDENARMGPKLMSKCKN